MACLLGEEEGNDHDDTGYDEQGEVGGSRLGQGCHVDVFVAGCPGYLLGMVSGDGYTFDIDEVVACTDSAQRK